MRIAVLPGLLAAILCGCSGEQTIVVTVTNPTPVSRPAEPVVLDYPTLQKSYPGISFEGTELVAEDGQPLPTQIDDLNGDQKWDEVVFQADFVPHQIRRFYFRRQRAARDSGDLFVRFWQRMLPADTLRPLQIKHLSTEHLETRRRYAGISWGNAQMTYDLKLDGSNTIGWMDRNTGQPVTAAPEAQRPAVVAPLSSATAAPAPGIGGLLLWDGETPAFPFNLFKFEAHVLATGPVRTVLRLDFTDWAAAGRFYKLTWLIMQFAGTAQVEQRVYLKNLRPEDPLPVAVTGLTGNGATAPLRNESQGYLMRRVPGTSRGDSLTLVLAVPAARIFTTEPTWPAHLFKLSLEKERPLVYYALAIPEKPAGVFLAQLSARLNAPLQIQYK